MGDDDGVGKRRADRIVGLGQSLLQNPAGTDQAAGFLVIGQMEFDRAV